MEVEILVFGRDEGVFNQIGNFLDRLKQPSLLGEFVDQSAFAGIDAADGFRGILRQLLVAGQIAAVDPEYGAKRQRAKKGGGDDPREDRSED